METVCASVCTPGEFFTKIRTLEYAGWSSRRLEIEGLRTLYGAPKANDLCEGS